MCECVYVVPVPGVPGRAQRALPLGRVGGDGRADVSVWWQVCMGIDVRGVACVCAWCGRGGAVRLRRESCAARHAPLLVSFWTWCGAGGVCHSGCQVKLGAERAVPVAVPQCSVQVPTYPRRPPPSLRGAHAHHATLRAAAEAQPPPSHEPPCTATAILSRRLPLLCRRRRC